MQKLWHIPLHCASSNPLTTTLSMVLLTTRLLVTLAPVQLGAQARGCCASKRAMITTINKCDFIFKSVQLHRHHIIYTTIDSIRIRIRDRKLRTNLIHPYPDLDCENNRSE